MFTCVFFRLYYIYESDIVIFKRYLTNIVGGKHIKKGISLITLVITIVVVIILAAAVILSLNQNNPIQNARVATVVQKKDSIESSVLMYVSSIKARTLGNLSTEQILITDENYKIVDVRCKTIKKDYI